jgi:uncharacterized membrane protein YhhN
MLNTLIILLALILLPTLLWFEKKVDRKGMLPTKTALSLLFIVAALVQPHPTGRYYGLLLAGLIFCLGGDVFLALPQKKMFLLGLISFLIGHVFYVLAFISVAHMTGWVWIGYAITIGISVVVFLWLKPHLGTMTIPVLFYVVVITAMVCAALTVYGNPLLREAGRNMVLAGAIAFYFSDLFVARDRFLKNEFINRLIGLPLYYLGQFLLAFSVGFLI